LHKKLISQYFRKTFIIERKKYGLFYDQDQSCVRIEIGVRSLQKNDRHWNYLGPIKAYTNRTN